MIKRLRSISAELAGALLGRCGCRRRGGVGAKAAPVCHAWMPLWEGCPAVDGLYGCCRCARARVRRAVPPVQGVRQEFALRELVLVSGLCPPALRLFRAQRTHVNWLARRTRRGAASRLRRGRTCWCSATTPLCPLRSVINRRDAAARKESVRRARTKHRLLGQSATTSALHTSALWPPQ